MSENTPSSSGSGPVSSSASNPPPNSTKEVEENYNVHVILTLAAYEVGRVTPRMKITLPRSLTKLPELIAAVLPALSSNPVASNRDVYAPFNISAAGRANIRRMALAWQDEMFRDKNVGTPQRTRPIFSSQTLKDTDFPKRLTPEQRQRLRDRFADTLNADFRYPYHVPCVSLEDQCLPTVKANLYTTPVDGGDGTPDYTVSDTDCLWDTGAHLTIISDDCLGPEMLKFLREDPANGPHRQTGAGPDGVMQVHVSALVRMSNAIIQLDTIAVVMPRQAIPNNRSGIILGQRGAIDRVSYISTPRSILVVEGKDPGEEYWGAFDVVKYLDAELELVHV